MRRRHLLSTAVAGGLALLAGCLGDDDDTDERDIDQGFQAIEAEAHQPPDGSNLDLHARPMNGFLDDRPAAIELTLTNQDDEDRRFGVNGPNPPFTGQHETITGEHLDGDGELVAVPEPYLEDEASGVGSAEFGEEDLGFPFTSEDECWQLEDVVDHRYEEPTSFRLDPDESITEEYLFYATADSQTCLATGDYEFAMNIREGNELIEIGFTITLE